MENGPIKAVVFDVGGVILINDNEDISDRIAQLIGVPIPEFKRSYWEHNHLSNVENMPWENMAMEVVRVFDSSPETEHRVRTLIKEHKAANRFNTELLGWFPLLHRSGLKVAIFSNATSELRDELTKKGISLLVDEIVISGEIGYQKPEKKAFDILFKKLDLPPSEVIFIDDSSKSLETAPEIGYIPILFKNTQQLRSDLEAKGVRLTN